MFIVTLVLASGLLLSNIFISPTYVDSPLSGRNKISEGVPDDNINESLPDTLFSFEIEGRSANFLASLDSRSVTIDQTIQMAIRKADFHINLVRFEGDTFLKTLRHKMLWGMDNRN